MNSNSNLGFSSAKAAAAVEGGGGGNWKFVTWHIGPDQDFGDKLNTQTVTGFLVEKIDKFGNNGSSAYIIRTQQGVDLLVWGTSVLIARMIQSKAERDGNMGILIGAMVQIKFLGDKRSKKGGTYKDFEVGALCYDGGAGEPVIYDLPQALSPAASPPPPANVGHAYQVNQPPPSSPPPPVAPQQPQYQQPPQQPPVNPYQQQQPHNPGGYQQPQAPAPAPPPLVGQPHTPPVQTGPNGYPQSWDQQQPQQPPVNPGKYDGEKVMGSASQPNPFK